MNRKRLSHTGYSVVMTLLIIALFTAILTGCATTGREHRNMTGVSSYFDKDAKPVWDAAIQAAEGIPMEVKDMEKGILRTHWVKGWSKIKTTGILLEGQWQERYRLIIRVTSEQSKTYVSINAQIETKAPGGSQAYRWTRVVSDGTIEQEFLKRLENILGSP